MMHYKGIATKKKVEKKVKQENGLGMQGGSHVKPHYQGKVLTDLKCLLGRANS